MVYRSSLSFILCGRSFNYLVGELAGVRSISETTNHGYLFCFRAVTLGCSGSSIFFRGRFAKSFCVSWKLGIDETITSSFMGLVAVKKLRGEIDDMSSVIFPDVSVRCFRRSLSTSHQAWLRDWHARFFCSTTKSVMPKHFCRCCPTLLPLP